MNIDILGISKLKWTGMGEFNSDDQYIYYCGQESLRRNGVAIMVNKRVQNAVLGCNLKNIRMQLNSRKNEGMEPKQKQYQAVDVTGDRSKVRCCKEQYCIGTWNVRSMNQGKLEVVKWDGKSECRHSRNQRTEMDWNG